MYTFLAAQPRENFQMTACRLFKGNFEIAEKIKILCGKILIFCKTRRRFKIVWTLLRTEAFGGTPTVGRDAGEKDQAKGTQAAVRANRAVDEARARGDECVSRAHADAE